MNDFTNMQRWAELYNLSDEFLLEAFRAYGEGQNFDDLFAYCMM